MELSLESGQLLNNLKCNIENIILEKTDFVRKLNIASNNEDPIEFVSVLESFERADITKCFEINEIFENLIISFLYSIYYYFYISIIIKKFFFP